MAKQEQIIKIRIDTGGSKGQLGALNKDVVKTGKSGKAAGTSMATSFAAARTAIFSAIPALKAFKFALISTGVGAIVVAIGSLIGFMAKAASKGAEFEKSLSTLKAISGATGETMEVLSDQAKQLGSTTIFTASQVVELQTELAKLGFSAGEIQNATPSILNLAASLDVSLADAASFAGSQIRAFGLDTSETQRVVDVMALSTTKSALDFGSLTESLKMAAPVMNATGVSVEKTAAMLGVLADTGIKGSLAGTGLSKTFIALNKEGISLEDAMAKVKGSTDQLGTAVDLVGVVGAKSLLNLANNGEKIAELEETFMGASDAVEQSGESFDGAAAAIAGIRADNLDGDLKGLSSAWEGLLLSFEDGGGIINTLRRGAVQLLTKAIQGFTTTVQFLGFFFKEAWDGMKEVAGGTGQIIAGSFQWLGGQIKKFANNVLLQIARIPILGSGIDKAAARRRVKEAASAIDEAEKKIKEGRDRLAAQQVKDATFMARFRKEQETKALVAEQKKQNEEMLELQQAQTEEEEKAAEERRKKREDNLKKLADLEKKYLRASQDMDDTSNAEKAARKRERAQAELDALELTNEEKKKAQANLDDYFDKLEEEAKEKDEAKATEEEAKRQSELEKKQADRMKEYELEKEFEQLTFEERRQLLADRRAAIDADELLSDEQKIEAKKLIGEAEAKLEEDKVKAKQMALDAVIGLAGAETGVGKALLLAKQLLAMKEMIMDMKRITFKGTKAVGEAAVDTASNVSSSSKIGFPQNIITIAAAIGQGISIMNTVKKAVRKSGGSAAGGTPPTAPPTVAPSAQSSSPAFNVIGASGTNQLAEAIGGQSQRPIKTFVVANEVTTEQALERNINAEASIS